ncbi:hypothetical protein K7X08_025091 [Anisodus acutangulus]|uniref:Zinc knuckle CX2CX3GHX4C domain-containing protein n=1 Tax=Anisodus acutangulus TaxID=402998 RepID=A0A9Q1M930_9SOLA|nr:hypothetical protein K7X08_025091 [Anisodus acutangulus]
MSSAPTSSISTNDDDTKIKNLIDTPDFRKSSNGYGFGQGGMEWKKPQSGYVCHRCNVPGHFIQHCPTNGFPNYDIKKLKLMATPSGGSVGVSKEIEGLSSVSSSSSKRSFRDIPPELHCPLCKGLMKDAVIASKCCFSSFCDKSIKNCNECPRAVEQKPIAEEAVKMKKRKKSCDDAAINMQCGATQNHVAAESYMSTMNPTAFYRQYMSYGHHVLPEESLRRQYVETRKAGFKRNMREMSSELPRPSVITC